MASMFGTAAGAVAGKKSGGGGGLGYSGSNSSSISTPQNLGGGIGAQSFNLGSLGIGSKGTLGNINGSTGAPVWVWYAAVGAGMLFVLLKMVRK